MKIPEERKNKEKYNNYFFARLVACLYEDEYS